MRISLITTLPKLAENKRIKEEVEGLGHEFELINLKNFNFMIKDGELASDPLTGLNTDIVIVRGVFLSIKTISAVITGLRKRGIKVFDNNFLEHRYSIDKVTDLVKLSLGEDIPVPDSGYTRDFSQYEAIAGDLGYPLVIKSTRMGKGASVYKINSKEELFAFIEEKEEDGKVAKNFILQKFIPYEVDLRVLIVGESVFTMRRIPAEGEFRANFSLGGSVEPYELDRKDEKLAKRALSTIDMTVGGVDLLITEKAESFVLEVNHTAGFVGMEKATDKNIGRVFVEHAIAAAK